MYNFKNVICTCITIACRIAAGSLPFVAEISRIEWSLGTKRWIELFVTSILRPLSHASPSLSLSPISSIYTHFDIAPSNL